MKQMMAFFLAIFLSVSHAQKVPRTIVMEDYFLYMKIKQGEQIVGYYVEHLEKDNNNWMWSSRKFDMAPDGKISRQMYLEVFFDADFAMTSFMRSVEMPGKPLSWYKGEVKGNELFGCNSRNIENKLELQDDAIVENLILLRFLTQKESKEQYYGLSLSDAKVTRWEAEISGKEKLRFDLNPPKSSEDASTSGTAQDKPKKSADESSPELGVLIVSLTKLTKDKPEKDIYRIATIGKDVPPCGVIIEKQTDTVCYVWMDKDEYSQVYRMLHPYRPESDKEAKLERLQQEVANLLSSDAKVRYRAVEEIEKIRLWQGIPALIEMLEDKDEKVRNAAYRALKKITARKMRQDPVLWRRWWITREELQKRQADAQKKDR